MQVRTLVAAWSAVVLASPALAAHPFISEDTGTQGAGRFELELGGSVARDAGNRAAEFDPQLSYGVLASLDAIVLPSVLWLSGDLIAPHGRRQGFGDTAFDVKWRFAEFEQASLGLRAGVDVATAQSGIPGYGGTAYHALAIATAVAGDWTLTGDAGYRRAPAGEGLRRDRYRFSAAAIRAVGDGWKLGANVAAESNPFASVATWPTVALVGVIGSVTPWLDVDAGYQARLNHAAPRQVIKVGATLRW